MLVPITAACIAAAAASYGVGEPALATILKTEGGRVGVCVTQANGMHDCGPAQINAEIWVPRLASLLHIPVGEAFYAIRDNGCFNVMAAAYILRLDEGKTGGDLWDAMGLYHSATPALKRQYELRLIQSYRELYGTH